MRLYRDAWLYVWVTATVIVIGLACLLRGATVVLLGCAAAGAGCWLLTTALSATTRAQATKLATTRRDLGAGLMAGAGLVALLFLAAVNALLAALVLLLAVATSPPFIAFLRRTGRRNGEGPRGASAVERRASGTPGAMPEESTDSDLCRAWRASFSALLDASNPVERGRVVRERQLLLEELERRHPDAVRVWLASAPRAADGPERYLRQSRPDDRDVA